ncbi:hypothetical protein Sjap_003254 [Stephania japonica]|uniref:EXPERA domain-containing protein n=1 Tax=Stephania japonica TaxID=461633 RepID=A0AAP0KQT6_9MAGN
MGGFWRYADVFLFLYFFSVVFATVIFAQVCVPARFFPAPLSEIYSWVAPKIRRYLKDEKLNFYEGMSWVVILVQWPAAMASVYGFICGKSWVGQACLIYGVSMLCCLISTLVEMIRSASRELLILSWLVSWPLMGVAMLAILRGLVGSSATAALRNAF